VIEAQFEAATRVLPLDCAQGAELPEKVAAVALVSGDAFPQSRPLVVLSRRLNPKQEGEACLRLEQGIAEGRATVVVLYAELAR
jgi:hypothetical protein